jgi:flagellin
MFSRINTNIDALRANMHLTQTGIALSKSLERLSSGRRINSAADDAAGMFIADGLRSQSSSMVQGVRNANDAIGVLNIIDKAIDEQIKLLDTMKQKAIQSAQDSQSKLTRQALQAEVVSLVDRLDSIAFGTKFNGASLLTGGFANKEFQVGSQSHESVIASVGPTISQKLGNTFFTTGALITANANVSLTFEDVDGSRDVTMEQVIISNSAGTGIGALASVINAHSDALGGVRASWKVVTTGGVAGNNPATDSVAAGTLTDFTINGINIGSINVEINDKNGSLVSSINSRTSDTGVEASIDVAGTLTLRSVDGRGIVLGGNNTAITGIAGANESNFGRLTLTRNGAHDIKLAANASRTSIGFDTRAIAGISLSGMRAELTSAQADAAGIFANSQIAFQLDAKGRPGVLTLDGSMAMMDIIDTALTHLDRIRASVGAAAEGLLVTQNYLQSSIVETKSAESQIRDVDFASESAVFQKTNVLAQSGNYALTQANALAQLVTRLFQ